MKIETLMADKIPCVIIDDFYTPEELQNIWMELEFLNPNLKPADETNAAHDDGILKTSKRGAFLDELYQDRSFSFILKHNRKQFDKELLLQLEEFHPWFRYIDNSDYDSTLLSYYEDSDFYGAHKDSSSITSLHWFYKEPKRFIGGDFIVEHLETIECRNNRIVFMPSCAYHEVTPISMPEDLKNQGLGRYCLSSFITRRGL